MYVCMYVCIRVDGRIRFEYTTCGRGNFWIRKEIVADSKISGYVWRGPQWHRVKSTIKQSMNILEYLPSSRYKYVFKVSYPLTLDAIVSSVIISSEIPTDWQRHKEAQLNWIEILHSIKTTNIQTRLELESEILQIWSLLRTLKEGNALVCNRQHMMTEPLALPFPKEPSTTSANCLRAMCLWDGPL